MNTTPLYAGVELGGSKCVCVLGTGPEDIRARSVIPTSSDANSTLDAIGRTLLDWRRTQGPVAALGIASFGPLDLDRTSASYGCITSTPKPGWQGVQVLDRIGAVLNVPTGFNTDVNGAALAEGRWGAARGLTDFAYVTVGTGIGVGIIVRGAPILGISHTEAGHIRIARLRGDSFAGVCAFHGDCLEGLASGPAIAARAGMPPDQVPADSPVWESVAHALAQLVHTLVLVTSPRRVVIGGGVAQDRPELLTRVRALLRASLNGYATAAVLDQYIVAPQLGALAGPLGAVALAADALIEQVSSTEQR
jgi:fructokinase